MLLKNEKVLVLFYVIVSIIAHAKGFRMAFYLFDTYVVCLLEYFVCQTVIEAAVQIEDLTQNIEASKERLEDKKADLSVCLIICFILPVSPARRRSR